MAIGPCSQVIQVGDFIYVSGQIGVDPVSVAVVQGITTTFCIERNSPYKLL